MSDLADSFSDSDLSLTDAGSVDGKSQECSTLLLPSSKLLTPFSGQLGNFTIFDKRLVMVMVTYTR